MLEADLSEDSASFAARVGCSSDGPTDDYMIRTGGDGSGGSDDSGLIGSVGPGRAYARSDDGEVAAQLATQFRGLERGCHDSMTTVGQSQGCQSQHLVPHAAMNS